MKYSTKKPISIKTCFGEYIYNTLTKEDTYILYMFIQYYNTYINRILDKYPGFYRDLFDYSPLVSVAITVFHFNIKHLNIDKHKNNIHTYKDIVSFSFDDSHNDCYRFKFFQQKVFDLLLSLRIK